MATGNYLSGKKIWGKFPFPVTEGICLALLGVMVSGRRLRGTYDRLIYLAFWTTQRNLSNWNLLHMSVLRGLGEFQSRWCVLARNYTQKKVWNYFHLEHLLVSNQYCEEDCKPNQVPIIERGDPVVHLKFAHALLLAVVVWFWNCDSEHPPPFSMTHRKWGTELSTPLKKHCLVIAVILYCSLHR